jgi:iron complex transport system substrate-binding protein
MRIVSLIPSGTDFVAALGLNDCLVGVSHECDHPVSQGLPALTSSIIPSGLAPAEIDLCVSEALQQADTNSSLYRTDRALLRDLKPDLVLTQEICDVCAVNAASVMCDLPPGARVLTLSATSFNGLWNDLRAVASATDSCADNLIASLQTRLGSVERAVAGRVRLRVLTLEWTDPPFVGGHWVPEIIECAGGIDVLGQTGELSRRVAWDEISSSDPDVVLLLPCGYSLQEVAAQARDLLQRPEYSRLRAVRDGSVWATDATRLFSRCTPASARAVEVIAGILHPGAWPAPSGVEAIRCPNEVGVASR